MRSFTFLNRASAQLLALLAFVLLAVVGMTPAHAQGVTLDGLVVKPTPIPSPAPIGLTVTGWQQSSGIGQASNSGGDGKGTTQSIANGVFKIGADTFLTGNSNPNCTADCKDTQAKLWVQGEQMVGAMASNQGVGNGTTSSVAGTNGYFVSGLRVDWNVPAQPGTNVPTYPPIAATSSEKPKP